MLLAENLYKSGEYCKAEAEYGQILKENPKNTTVMLNIGNVLYLQNKLEQARKVYQEILMIKPSSFGALSNLGFIYAQEREFDKAIPIFEFIVLNVPNDQISRANLGNYYLTVGRLKEGFGEYGWRASGRKEINTIHGNIPVWNGSNIWGKKIVLATEQGIGDIFHFIRYAKLLKECGAHVAVKLHRKFLKPILSLCPYIDEIISHDVYGGFDFKERLMSLPYKCKTEIDSVPMDVPYLFANKSLVNFWKQMLASDSKIKIGLCWSVEAKAELFTSHKSCKRSIDISAFEPIVNSSASFYSLQKDFQNGIKTGGLVVHGFGDDFDNGSGAFMDSAAIIKNLDLVVTVDTSVAHLAGALGVPVWVLLPYESDWRWMLERNDSPWYPTMRLFRQKKPGEWASVVEEISQELSKVIQKGKK
jgi:ADP-heptose:LPS heptosyltransferase